MRPPGLPVSLHVLPAGSVLLRDDTTLHFLSPTNLCPQRQPAAFDALSCVYPRPRDPSAFACVQTTPQLAVTVWRYIAEGVPEELICIRERTVVYADSISGLQNVPCCWDTDGRAIVFGLPMSRITVVDLSDPSSPPPIHVFATPDLSDVKAVAPSPHAADVFAVACASGRTFLCRLSPENTKDADNMFVPDVLHALPELDGRPVAVLAFHPTSTDPESLMLAILHTPTPALEGLVSDGKAGGEEEIQVWCINVGKSVNLIRRLHHSLSVSGPADSDRYLKWSKNGRVVQFIGNSLIVYDVRRNNGSQEIIRTPEGTRIVAVDLQRETGMAWVLDSAMQLHIYDLLHCTQLLSANVELDTFVWPSSEQVPHTPKSFTLSPPRLRSSGMSGQDKDVLRRKSSDLLAYYLNRSPDRDEIVAAVRGTRDDFAANPAAPMERQVTEQDDDEEQSVFPATAIRATSPLWTFTEPGVAPTAPQQQPSLHSDYPFTTDIYVQPPTAIPADLQEPADQELAMPEPILPDCLFSHLGELMQGSDTGLDFSPSAPSTPRTILELLFGWPPAYVGTSVRDLVAWERQQAVAHTPPACSAFVRAILNIWLRDAGGSNPVRDLELTLASLQANPSTRNMTVSISWLVYAMNLVALQPDMSSPGVGNERQQMARIFTDTVLFRDKNTYGDDVEAVHLATGILIGCGLIKEARDIYRTNAYYLEATILSLLFGLPVEEILREWIVQAMETGAERISIRW
ncbi:hypothetical protein POJ06DRAFT_283506 [Lipomyces tetrasporus]|uniref:Uncharacterized protein n=1 Tax=Lipomyces tetrasporus TaxID=54092 RepID=A0AAD7VQ58_9ASCO|nr:uncharacterized protein POJ06DRAFT_283506 [Lipomyces tetrasporus]KAJ8097526.1 hypothetical protein POJ06DRAFT_283506 [Lipomyces tetrasporus]